MDLKTIQEYYPLYGTLVGYYNTDQSFIVTKYEQVANIDRWRDAPLDWGEGSMPFIRYNDGKFECWYFVYNRVKGYYTEDEWGEDYLLVTHDEEFGYEVINPWYLTNNQVIIVPDDTDCELYFYDWDEMTRYENQLESVARQFDPAAYEEGRILTSYDAVKNFVANMEENS